MAQTGYTPILIYSSSTAAQAPAVGNLTNSTLGSELAINITDGKLFYKDNANAVQVIAWKVTPTTAGGTGLTSYTAGDLLYYATGTTLTKLAIGASTNILTSSGSAPQWSAASGITVGTATNLAGGLAGSLPYQSGAGATTFLGIGAANTVLTSSGSAPQWSTGLTLSGNVSAAALIPSGTTVPTNGWYLPSANVVAIANNSGFTANFDASRNFNLGQATSALQSGGTGITIYGSSFAEIKFLNSTTGTALTDGTAFVNSGSNFSINNREAGSLTLGTSNTVRWSIDSGGDITLSTGNIIQGTAAKGINFTANTPAAGMTSELLNWYEEGTWTPTLQGGTTAGSYTLNSVNAYYTRVGRQVIINARFDVTVNSAGTGGAKFGGLPFTKSASQFMTGSVVTSSVTYAANIISLSVQAWTSGASTDFSIAGVRSGTTPSDLDVTGIVTGSIFYMTFTYFV